MQDQKHIDDECEALEQLTIEMTRQTQVPQPLPSACGEVALLRDQAQFQPQAYVLHMAKEAVQRGARLHEHSPVIHIDHEAKIVATASASVQADEIVLATHSPKGFHLLHAAMPVHREYALALPWNNSSLPPGIYWWHGQHSLSFRPHEYQGQQFLICVGQAHKTGNHDAANGFKKLWEQVQSALHLNINDEKASESFMAYQWSAQNYQSADSLPYIGRDASKCWVATGFGADGLVWGTVAAHELAAQLHGEMSHFGELCRPGRFTPLKSAKNIAKTTITSAKAFIKDYLTQRQEQHLTHMEKGVGAIVEAEGESFAAYRSSEGELFAVSPICTHMGCKVHWNNAETSWDCPCHGSRFAPDGSVLEGPALQPLARKHLRLEPDTKP